MRGGDADCNVDEPRRYGKGRSLCLAFLHPSSLQLPELFIAAHIDGTVADCRKGMLYFKESGDDLR